MKEQELKYRVKYINNPVMNYYCIITYQIGSKEPLKASVRQQSDVHSYMKKIRDKHNVEFEFYGCTFTGEAYNIKQKYQQYILRYQGMTDRERAEYYKK